MIIYGLKKIELNTSHLSLPCTKCGHDYLWLHIYRNFFSLYFFPIIPLQKGGIVNCPNCSTELNKKAFIKQLDAEEFNHEAKHFIESAFKSAKTPLYWFIAPLVIIFLIIGGLMMGHRADEMNKQFLRDYLQNPSSNVIVVSKSPTDAYPYFITYIPEIRDQYVVIFAWGYSYESLAEAKKAAQLASRSIDEGKLIDHFSEPYLILKEHLQVGDIVHVNHLKKIPDWKQYVSYEDPEGILELFKS